MSLKTDIVVVSEYTVKGRDGRGSRGSTPGDYVTQYMSRDEAVEDLTPVRLRDLDQYVTRYMARADAVEHAGSVQDVRTGIDKSQRMSGVAFSRGDISLSREKLQNISNEIQDLFDNGKTVMKTVLSFTEEYLSKNGVLEPGFKHKTKGDFKGHVDQLKLRSAIMRGMERVAGEYDDLCWVGVIQVDSDHIHCHLAMVDRGKGNLANDGKQRGKLSSKIKNLLRRGVDASLDENKTVAFLASNVQFDRRNALCHVKDFSHRMMKEGGLAQFLLACLPEDKRLWRASSNNRQMKKANSVTRQFVMDVLQQPGSGYDSALESVEKYARERQDREGLSDTEYGKLYRNGQERIITDCINGVYRVLRELPEEERGVSTPMLDFMSTDYETAASESSRDPMAEFGFRLRSYAGRLEHHKQQYREVKRQRKAYEQVDNPVYESKPFYEFLQFEERYQLMLMNKYQHFLLFLPGENVYSDRLEQVRREQAELDNMTRLFEDDAVRTMPDKIAEQYGQEHYNIRGGRFLPNQADIFEQRLSLRREAFQDELDDFRGDLAEHGLVLNTNIEPWSVQKGVMYPFDEVKALDLHHMTYDFAGNVKVSKRNAGAFARATKERVEKYNDAVAYLLSSGQEEAVRNLPSADIRAMLQMAEKMMDDEVLPSARKELTSEHKANTVELDQAYQAMLQQSIVETVEGFGDSFVE